MNETNTRKFSALIDELGYKLLAIEFADELNDKELEDTLNTIADNWNMEFTEDNTGLIHVSNYEDEEEDYTYSEDEPSWQELMQDRYPTCDDGTVFNTMSGFQPLFFLSMFNCVDTMMEKIPDNMAARFGILQIRKEASRKGEQMNTRITKVFKRGGKVTMIHCGEWPNITAYQRVDIDGERFFKLYMYGKHKLYKPNKKTHCMEYVKSV